MSSASRDGVVGLPASRQHAAAVAQAAAAVVAAAGFAVIGVKAWGQIERLIWRPEELSRALSAYASLATTFPLRFACLVLGSVGLMLAAEYRPRALLRTSTTAWASLGVAGTAAYLLSALDVGSRLIFAVVLGACVAAATLLASRRGPEDWTAERPIRPSRGRSVLPVAIGLAGGLLAVRASIEPITEWDAVVYHVSFARDWLDSLPGLPHAAGPSVGAELSYNYPALFPSMTVALAGALHLSADTVARLLSPLAAITVFAVLRSAAFARAGSFAAWAGPMFLLGSTFFVAYGQWPTAYMLMTLFLVLAVALLVTARRLGIATALCLGLSAATGLVGAVFTGAVVVAYFAWRFARSARGGLLAVHRDLAAETLRASAKVSLLVVPLGVVVVASLKRTGGLFFPWVTWPNAADLLPPLYWHATEREILANSYGQFDLSVGGFVAPLVGIAKSGLLAPGGLALEGLIVAVCAVGLARRSRALLVGAATVAGIVLMFVVLELVWLRYFVPIVVAAAAGLAIALTGLREQRGGLEFVAYVGGVAAACLCTASGVAYALAGPNDRTYTSKMDYRAEKSSPFESARRAADTRQRLQVVYGDDSRAWVDVNRLDSAGIGVGTFDIRNYYARYRSNRQLDGLAGAAITATDGAAVAEQLKARRIDAVFVPSWFWEPGAARHPLADRSPVALWVGAPALRAARVYLPDPYVSFPSVLYRVGPALSAGRLQRLLGAPSFSVAGPLSTRRRSIPGGFAISGPLGGSLHWRIAAPVTEVGGPSIRLTSSSGQAPGVSVYEPSDPTLVGPAAFVDCKRVPRWAQNSIVDVTFPGSPLGFANLDVGLGRGMRTVSAAIRDLPASDKVLVRACGDPASARGGIFPIGSTAGRIIVHGASSGQLALAFDYWDAGHQPVSFNAYDEARDRWVYGAAQLHRCNSGRWVHARLPIVRRAPAADQSVELGPVVTGRNLIVRNLRLVRGARRTDCETMRG